MTSPFDDPEFTAQLAQMGVVHTPGLAARMMDELAPLLAAEGIDLNSLDGDVDLDNLNAALARATERHNLALFTPVGAQRAGALAVLRQFAELMADGDADRAAAVLAGVESDPAGDAPAISHLIGVSLGLLDTWHSDPGLRAAFAATRVPRWNRAARAAATDVLALARKGRAFASLASLHRHGGLALFEGAAILVAASLSAWAASEKTSVRDLAGRVLVGGASAGRAAPTRPSAASTHRPGSSFMRPQETRGRRGLRPPAPGHAGARSRQSADRELLRGFGAWLGRAPSIAAPSVDDELQMMQSLVGIARAEGLNLRQAADVELLIDLLRDADLEGPEALGAALETLHDYVHFRLEDGHDLDRWEEAHEAVEDALADAGFGPLEAMLEDAEMVAPEARRRALAQTQLIAAVKELLEWVSTGRPVTQTGGVRRGDIERVAEMLGVQAVGVAKRVGNYWDEDAPVQALSMADVPLLPQWWEALSAAEVIRTNSSSVRLGSAAAEWSAEALPPLELAEAVAAVFAAATLTAPMKTGYGSYIVRESLPQLIRALAPEGPDDRDAPALGHGPVWTLRNLERAGLVTIGASNSLQVPNGLRAAVAHGLVLAVSLLAGPDEG